MIVYSDSPISRALSSTLNALSCALKQQLGTRLIDTVQSYNSLLVVYDCLQIDFVSITQLINTTVENLAAQQENGKIIELPVYYGTETGLDFERLCQQKALTPTQLIKLHSQQDYCVYAIGFAPGFAFLGEVDIALAEPRLATPRKQVNKGAVGIADRQTAVYPNNSPGGWNLIGNCPLTFFEPSNTSPLLFAVGDTVRFHPIERAEFLNLGGQL